MGVPLGEPEKQPLHLHAAARFQHFLNPLRAQSSNRLHQDVRLMKGLLGREKVKKLAKCSLRRGDIEFPSPMSPCGARPSRCVGIEELVCLVFDELSVSRYPLDPARQAAIGIEVDFRLARKAEIMRQALQLECAATADVHGFVK